MDDKVRRLVVLDDIDDLHVQRMEDGGLYSELYVCRPAAQVSMAGQERRGKVLCAGG